MAHCNTSFKKNILNADISSYLYEELRSTVNWTDGIRSKNGFTRKAYTVSPNDPLFLPLMEYVNVSLKSLTNKNYIILGLYLNYYENGQMYTPNHSHKNSHQLVISLGATRTLVVSKKEYQMASGDAIIFGSSIHGVPKSDTNQGRISIATFMILDPIQ